MSVPATDNTSNDYELARAGHGTLAMTIPAPAKWASSNAIPHTQNTAPVLEFRCLYTADLRRKQKRWQDGRLKYHAFNKRIMVYDDHGNFVGDSHWRGEHTFGEGEEIELERRGILVRVSECVGTREQDLTHLLNKVVKDRHQMAHARAVESPWPSVRTESVDLPRANPTDLRYVKRRKPNKSPASKNGYAQTLTGATLSFSATFSTAASRRHEPVRFRAMDLPIDDTDISAVTGINCVPQERSSVSRMSLTRTGRSQAIGVPKRFSPTRVDHGHARKVVGAALVPEHAPLLEENGLTTMATAEDVFTNIDAYEKKFLQSENATRSSYQVIDLANNHQNNPSRNSLSQYHEDQPEKPINPLRIKTRPKRKLLSVTTTLPSRPPSFDEPSFENCNGTNCLPTRPRRDQEQLVFQECSEQTAPATETGPMDMKDCRPSPSVTAGIDHHDTDVTLTCKALGHIGRAEGWYANNNSDQGAWSREAFDLFDWKPAADAAGASLVASTKC